MLQRMMRSRLHGQPHEIYRRWNAKMHGTDTGMGTGIQRFLKYLGYDMSRICVLIYLLSIFFIYC